jgi:cellulose synthase/poly-beta-1,6-N-acetylglucosamine synthase-like glycosyltransferase
VRHRIGSTAALLAAVSVQVLLAVTWLEAFLVVVSVFMLTVAATTIVFQLYKWWQPERSDPHRYGEPDEPRLPGVILVPMRDEESVAEHTLRRLAALNHPDYWVVPIVDHPDDPGTASIAHEMALRHSRRVLVCPYPEDTDVHNKPIGLNAAVRMLEQMGVRYEWLGIADAEDLFHPDLLRLVDYRFRVTGAAVVQCGVQLMNFAAHPHAVQRPRGPFPRLRRWYKAQTSAWWRVANVLEYFKWFQSRLKLQAVTRVMPLGGNTVFFRRQFLLALENRYGQWWDESCLTEDCKIGVLASVLGATIDVVYVDHMVTQEETPPSLGAFLRQRVRWMQGFVQVFFEGDWLDLPTLTQRVLAVYVLGFQFFQAFTAVFAPVALALALVHKSAVTVALLATIPLALGILSVALDVVMLSQFGRTFGQKVRLRDYLGLIAGAYPYQIILSIAAVWALIRFAVGRNNWVKTRHQGAHLGAEPEVARP